MSTEIIKSDTVLSRETALRGEFETFRKNQMSATLEDARRIDALERQIKISETLLLEKR